MIVMDPKTIQELVTWAINHHVTLDVTYREELRLISPIRLGWKTTEKDIINLNLFCYQFGGVWAPGLAPLGSPDNFRCWNLDDITFVQTTDAAWEDWQHLNMGPSTCIDDVLAGPPVSD